MQRLILPRSVRQKDYLTVLGGQRSCYLRLVLMAWKSDLHDGAQMDRQCTLHPPEKNGYGNVSTPTPRKHQTREAETAENTACAIIQIWPLIYSIHPNKPHAALQETNTRGLKMRTTRTCSCCASPYRRKNTVIYAKMKSWGCENVSNGVG